MVLIIEKWRSYYSSSSHFDWVIPVIALTISLVIGGANYIKYNGHNYEVIQGKHYFDASASWYYGGYVSQSFLLSDQETLQIHRESEGNIKNIPSFNQNDKSVYTSAYQNDADRLFVPFVVALILKLTLGSIDIPGAFAVFNLLNWATFVFLGTLLSRNFVTGIREHVIVFSLLLAMPMFPMMIGSTKGQLLGMTFFMAAVLSNKYALDHSKLVFVIISAASFTLSFYASGAFLFLAIYYFSKFIMSCYRKDSLREYIFLSLGIGLALILRSWINSTYGLRPATEYFDIGQMLTKTIQWFVVLITGGDIQQEWFLNYQGFVFFQGFIPGVIRSIYDYNVFLIALGVIGGIFYSTARTCMLFALSMIMFEAGLIITGWSFFYAYFAIGTMLFISYAAAITLSNATKINGITHILCISSLIALMAYYSTDLLNGTNMYVERYYGNVGYEYTGHISVYHDDVLTEY